MRTTPVSLLILLILFLSIPTVCLCDTTDIRTRSDFDTKVLGDTDAKILLFSADWCRYCHKLKPVINKVSKEYSDNMGVYIIDVDSLNRLSDEYNIEGLPTIVIMKDGKEQERIVGYSKENTIRDLFDRNMK